MEHNKIEMTFTTEDEKKAKEILSKLKELCQKEKLNDATFILMKWEKVQWHVKAY